jgi:hypothetical protein
VSSRPQSLIDMLKASSDLIEAMLEILQRTRWLQTARNVLEFQQMLVQGAWVKVCVLASACHVMHALGSLCAGAPSASLGGGPLGRCCGPGC